MLCAALTTLRPSTRSRQVQRSGACAERHHSAAGRGRAVARQPARRAAGGAGESGGAHNVRRMQHQLAALSTAAPRLLLPLLLRLTGKRRRPLLACLHPAQQIRCGQAGGAAQRGDGRRQCVGPRAELRVQRLLRIRNVVGNDWAPPASTCPGPPCSARLPSGRGRGAPGRLTGWHSCPTPPCSGQLPSRRGQDAADEPGPGCPNLPRHAALPRGYAAGRWAGRKDWKLVRLTQPGA